MEHTRERLLDAAIDILIEDGSDELSLRKVAERAGVSAPTVYRHFSTRPELIDALIAWIDARLQAPKGEPDLEELIVQLPSLYQAFSDHARMMTAYVRASAGDVQAAGRRNHRRRIEAGVRRWLPQLSESEATAFAPVIQQFISSATWDTWRTLWQLDGERAGRIAAWAVSILVDAVRRDRAGFARAAAATPEGTTKAPARGRKR